MEFTRFALFMAVKEALGHGVDLNIRVAVIKRRINSIVEWEETRAVEPLEFWVSRKFEDNGRFSIRWSDDNRIYRYSVRDDGLVTVLLRTGDP